MMQISAGGICRVSGSSGVSGGAKRRVAKARTVSAPATVVPEQQRCLQVRQGTSPDHVRFQFLNLGRGMTNQNGVEKAIGLAKLAKSDGYPDFVAYTEVSGPAGSGDLRKWLGPKMSEQYSIMLWSQRSVAADGIHGAAATAGGGIALLVHKRLNVTARQLPMFASDEDAALLDGHLRVWQFDHVGQVERKRQPIVITLAYFPPEGRWGKKVRNLMARCIGDINHHIVELRRTKHVFDVTLAHTNAPDGGCDVELVSERLDALSTVEAGQYVKSSLQHKRSADGHRGVLSTRSGSSRLHLRRAFSQKQRFRASDFGVGLVQSAAECGKCPLTGVLNHAQSTSWTKVESGGRCRECSLGHANKCLRLLKSKKAKKKTGVGFSCVNSLRMRSFHDVVWVPSDLVARALVDPSGGRRFVHSVTKRVIWAPGTPIDHAVTFVRLLVGRLPRFSKYVGPTAALKRQPKRQHLPFGLSQRAEFEREFAARLDSRFALLNTEDMDVETLSAKFIDECLAVASEVGDKFGSNQSVDPVFGEYRSCKRRLRKCQSALVKFLRNSRLESSASAAEKKKWKREREILNIRCTVASRQLDRAISVWQAQRQSDDRRRAPRQYWEGLRVSAVDLGAPEASKSLILDHQTSAQGQFVTADPAECRRNMQADREKLYKIPHLEASCWQRSKVAAAELHVENSALQGLSPNSAAAMSASDAAAPLQAFVEANGPVGDLRAEISVARSKRHCRRVDADAVAERDRPFTADEVQQCLNCLQDVGPGTDGVAPAMLSALGCGATVDAICDLFNKSFQSGLTPLDWREHRTLFLYKGKDSDPFHLGNYRGISIDRFLLKLWAMLFTTRLEAFMARTQGLSFMQGGFRRLRGTPESVLALTEAVRSVVDSRDRPASAVELVFLDVKVAYDSVLHPILWQRCLSMGIDGKFLAALQSIYCGAVSRVDVSGQLLDEVPLSRGVLQGNPLSPLLFNIYIDGAIRELSRLRGVDGKPLGIWLPRVGSKRESATADDYMQCSFFADDGVCVECAHDSLQMMVDSLATNFSSLGLSFNVPKTKWMIVPPASWQEEQYREKKSIALRNPLTLYGLPIELVDKFDYLGVRMGWRWDFSLAWGLAIDRARRVYFAACRGGWQRRAGALVSMLDFARAKIFSHFHYISAVSGACGPKTTSPWCKCDDIVGRVLRTITGMYHADVTALKIETGVWDTDAHIHMMLLRFWRKCCSADPNAIFNRAIRVGLSALSELFKKDPFSSFALHSNTLHRVSWAQSLFAAAARFGLSVKDIDKADPDLLVVVQKSEDDQTWVTVPQDGDIQLFEFVRICARPSPDQAIATVVFEEGRNCWRLPMGTQRDEALCRWSPELKSAVYAALRMRGNWYRNVAVQKFLSSQFGSAAVNEPLPRLSVWASTISGSSLQPYWYLTDARLARWLVCVRFDQCPTEDFWRTTFHGSQLPRIDDRHLRACYLCPPINGSVGIFWPETLMHVLLICPDAGLRACRDQFVLDLTAFANRLDADSVPNLRPSPNFADRSVIFTILQLCTGVGPHVGAPILQQQVPLVSADPIVLRQSPQFVRDVHQARRTIEWMEPIFRRWLDIVRSPRCNDLPYHSAGHRLAELVAKHVKDMFTFRNLALTSATVAPSFQRRGRDPVQPRVVAQPRSQRTRAATLNLYRAALADFSDDGSAPVVLQVPAVTVVNARRTVSASEPNNSIR